MKEFSDSQREQHNIGIGAYLVNSGYNECNKSSKDSGVHLARPKYRPDIDGLRAIAVLSVIGFHAFSGVVPGGFIGVDIFFVISGYLISTIVFDNLEHETFSILEFYERRVRRIFPALITVMLTSIVFGWYVLLTDEYKQMGKHVAAASAFVENFVLWNESGYFDTVAESKPMLHLWSLAVEEQFYIFWPLSLAFIWKCKWNFLYITAAIAIVSFVSNIYFSNSDPTADFYSPMARFWELMIGGILAYLTLHRPKLIQTHKNIQSALGFACLALGLILVNKDRAFPGWWALLPTIGAFLIISAGPAAWLNRNILSNRLFVLIGLISYPLYLWHWPLLSFARIIRPQYGYKLSVALIGLTIILSTATYRYIEYRFRKSGARSKTLVPLVAGISLVLSAGLLISGAQIEPRLHTFKVPSKNEWDFLKSTKVDFNTNGTGFYRFHQEREKITLFIGDSQLAQYAERIFRVQNLDANRNGAVFAIGGGCPPIQNVYTDDISRNSCWRNREEALNFALEKRVSKVVIGGSWNWYFLLNSNYFYLDKDVRESLSSVAGAEKALNTLENMMSKLKKSGKEVYFLLGNPISNENDPHFYVSRLAKVGSLPDRYAVLKESQRQLRFNLIELAKRSGASVIDPYLTLCKNNECERISETGAPIFIDGSHFNPDWAIEHTGYIDVTIGH